MFIAPDKDMRRGKDNRYLIIGHGPFQKEWHSYCETHYYWEEECALCEVGNWVNVWKRFVSEWWKDIYSDHYHK